MVKLLQQRHDELGFLRNWILRIRVTLHHVHGVDVVRAPRSDVDDLRPKLA